MVARVGQAPHQLGHVRRHQAFKRLAKIRMLGVVLGVHLRDTPDDAWPVAMGNAVVPRLPGASTLGLQGCGVLIEPTADGLLLFAGQVANRLAHLAPGKRFDVA